jgi:hypothetical protein
MTERFNMGEINVDELLKILKDRFEAHRERHPDISWDRVEIRINENSKALESLAAMEATGGEPDVTGINPVTNQIVFMDCSPESPVGRRNLCYDQQALESRKSAKPRGSAWGIAKDMGIEILTEDHYRQLQQLGSFDLKTSSWISTPESIRKLGGALFGDRRYDAVFIYHNGAESYYGVRGFRGMIKI